MLQGIMMYTDLRLPNGDLCVMGSWYQVWHYRTISSPTDFWKHLLFFLVCCKVFVGLIIYHCDGPYTRALSLNILSWARGDVLRWGINCFWVNRAVWKSLRFEDCLEPSCFKVAPFLLRKRKISGCCTLAKWEIFLCSDLQGGAHGPRVQIYPSNN